MITQQPNLSPFFITCIYDILVKTSRWSFSAQPQLPGRDWYDQDVLRSGWDAQVHLQHHDAPESPPGGNNNDAGSIHREPIPPKK